jgi:hypothetical protein
VVIVITYGYSVAVTHGLLLPDAAALAETADVLCKPKNRATTLHWHSRR